MAGSGEGNGNGIRSRMGRVRHGLGFSARVANQISLMKWTNDIKPAGAEKKDIRVLFS